MFSKRKFSLYDFRLTLNMLGPFQQVESECLSEDGAEEMGNISEDLEQQLCTLWDMSANQVHYATEGNHHYYGKDETLHRCIY